MQYQAKYGKLLGICVTIFCLLPWAAMADSTVKNLNFFKNLKEQTSKTQESSPYLNLKSKQLILDRTSVHKTITEGPRTGGGGNNCALSIQHNTMNLIRIVQKDKTILTEEQKGRLLDKISNAKFYLEEKLFIDQESKDAINYPNFNEITVTRTACEFYLNEISINSAAFLLHEYLGLAKIEDASYEISGEFKSRYQIDGSFDYQFATNNSATINSSCINSILQIRKLGNTLVVVSSNEWVKRFPAPLFIPLSVGDMKDLSKIALYNGQTNSERALIRDYQNRVTLDIQAERCSLFSSDICDTVTIWTGIQVDKYRQVRSKPLTTGCEY